MNFSEFKGFLEGIEQSFVDGRPTAEQWKQIRQKMINVHPDTQYYPVHPPLQPQIQPANPFFPGAPLWTTIGSHG